jgi:hypothetical protein
MQAPLLIAPLALLPAAAGACEPCVPLVDARIHEPDFWLHLALMLLPVLLLLVLAAVLHRIDRSSGDTP